MTTDNPASNEHHPPIGGAPALGAGTRDLPRLRSPHATKFRVVIAVLVGIAAGALAVAVVVAARQSGPTRLVAGAWSSWRPTAAGSTGVLEIAQHIAPYYRQNATQQLDVITPIGLSQPNAAGTTTGNGLTVAVNESTSSKNQSLGLLSGRTIAYNVCGLGSRDCTLAGTPSVARMLLLRREALELALYTFRYIGDSQNVVVVLPPGHTVTATGAGTQGVTVALLFLRSELQPWLNVPLSRTLQQYPPDLTQLGVWSRSQEAAFVDQVTAHGLFSSQVEALQVGGSALVLTPLPAQ